MAAMTAFTVRKWHKWLSLIIGVQAMFWLISGVYMVVVDLDFIHGDHLVVNMEDHLPENSVPLTSFAAIQQRFPTAYEISLTTWTGQPHYRVKGPEGSHLIDAVTGLERSPLSESDAIALAQYHYTGDGPVVSSVLLTNEDTPPSEIQTRPLPLWQIRFDDFGETAFYVSPDEGHLVTRRHTFWRVFDFVWMFHIMDFEAREDVNNNLFRVAAIFGTVMSLFGLWLLFFSFTSRKNSTGKDDAAEAGGRA